MKKRDQEILIIKERIEDSFESRIGMHIRIVIIIVTSLK